MRTVLQTPLARSITWYLVAVFAVMGALPPDALALFVPTDAQAVYDRQADLGRLQAVLESKIVEQRLSDLGLSREEIQSRLQQLSDDQIHQLATRVDSLWAGGDGAAVVIVVLVIVLAVFIYFYVTRQRVVVTK